MNKYLVTLAGTLFLVGLIAAVANNKTSDSEVKAFSLPLHSVSNANRVIILPNYRNDTQTLIDCAKYANYCPAVVGKSRHFFPGFFGYNFQVTVDDSGNGVFTGTLEAPYNSTEVILKTSSHGNPYQIVNFLDGNGTLIIFGQIKRTAAGLYEATLIKEAHIKVRGDDPEYHFIENALKQFYADRYFYVQNYVNSVLSKVSSRRSFSFSDTNRAIVLPNYRNDTQTLIDCAKYANYCPAVVGESKHFFPGFFGYNFQVTVDDSGNGFFSGTLEVPYNSTEVILKTSSHGNPYQIVNFLDGNGTLVILGQVQRTLTGSLEATLIKETIIEVREDDPEYHFIENALKQFYADRYLYVQNFVNSELSKVTSLRSF